MTVLRAYTEADRVLTEALETNADTMRDLGGPIPREEIEAIHRRRADGVAAGDVWWLVIAETPDGPGLGTIGIWEHEVDGETIHETGWMLLSEARGRGHARRALGQLIARARADGGFARLHAFPSVTNERSNALCRDTGFTRTGEREFDYRGRPLRCAVWVLDLDSR